MFRVIEWDVSGHPGLRVCEHPGMRVGGEETLGLKSFRAIGSPGMLLVKGKKGLVSAKRFKVIEHPGIWV